MEQRQQTILEEFENDGIAEDGFMAIQVNRLRQLGSPAVEALQNANRKLAISAALGGAALMVAGAATGGFVGRRLATR